MSDANRTQVSVVEESTPGTTPASPQLQLLRITGSNLAFSKQTTTSNELAPDGQVKDRITTGYEAGGDLPMEFSYGNGDTTVLRGVLRSEWVPAPIRYNNGTADSNITDVTASAVTVVAAAGTQVNYGSFAVGHLVRTSGFSAAGNNGLRRAGAGTTGTSVALAGGTIDATPSATARMKAVGFEGTAGDITATASGLASTALDFTTLGLVAGMWVWVGGAVAGQQFATAANRGWARISAIATNALTFDVLPTGWGVDAGATKTIRVFFGDYLRNGTTRRHFTIEQAYLDLSPVEYDYFTGMWAGSFQLQLQAKSVATCRYGFMGLDQQNTTTRVTTPTELPASTNDVLNTSANVGTLLVNGAALPGGNYVTGVDLTISNTPRRKDAIGTAGSVGIGSGRMQVTARLNTYYGSNALRTYIRNSTAVSYFLPLLDPNGTSAFLFDFPRVKFGDGTPSVPGVDQDRMLDTDLVALKHPTLGYTVHLQRVEEFGT